MNILVTGKLSPITSETLQALAENHKVACAAADLVDAQFDASITPFTLSPQDADFEKILHSYNFDTVIFFSQTAYSDTVSYNEFDALERCLQLCTRHDINRFLYLCPNTRPENPGTGSKSEQHVLYEACHRLCDFYRSHKAMSVIIAYIPNIYGGNETASLIGSAMQEAKKKASVHFRGRSDQYCSFLASKDLSSLLLRICENWPGEYKQFDIPPAETLSLKMVGELLKKQYPTLRMTFTPTEFTENTHYSDNVTRTEFAWSPVSRLEKELPRIEEQQNRSGAENQKQSLWEQLHCFLSGHPFILRTVELILGFILMEFLNQITDTYAQFHYVDFRLLYVVTLGTLHGIKTGLAAAFLASASLLWAMVTTHSAWYAVALDIDTWLPFIFLFLIGALTGYVKDKLVSDNKFLSEEKEQLEEKYVLLSEFYTSSLINKNHFKTQIVSYRDSFGRLFEISKNLDSTLVEEVYSEALMSLEGILNNRSICIYKADPSSSYGRLIVCSKEMRDIAGKSLKLTDYPEMMNSFSDGEVWTNRDRLENYPEYAFPVYSADTLIALIRIQKTSYDQMAVYYENLVKIVCGLVKIALIRALDYTRNTEEKMYLPGTYILNQEHFSRMMETKDKMTQTGTAEHILIRLDIPKENYTEISAKVSTVIRSTDFMGIGKDGQLYLCLSQTNRENAQLVLMRIQNRGVPVRAYDMEG